MKNKPVINLEPKNEESKSFLQNFNKSKLNLINSGQKFPKDYDKTLNHLIYVEISAYSTLMAYTITYYLSVDYLSSSYFAAINSYLTVMIFIVIWFHSVYRYTQQSIFNVMRLKNINSNCFAKNKYLKWIYYHEVKTHLLLTYMKRYPQKPCNDVFLLNIVISCFLIQSRRAIKIFTLLLIASSVKYYFQNGTLHINYDIFIMIILSLFVMFISSRLAKVTIRSYINDVTS